MPMTTQEALNKILALKKKQEAGESTVEDEQKLRELNEYLAKNKAGKSMFGGGRNQLEEMEQ